MSFSVTIPTGFLLNSITSLPILYRSKISRAPRMLVLGEIEIGCLMIDARGTGIFTRTFGCLFIKNEHLFLLYQLVTKYQR
jgi:hypothetical protein